MTSVNALYLRALGVVDIKPLANLSSGSNSVVDSDASAAHVENLMESKAPHRFPTIAWIILRLIHRGLENSASLPRYPQHYYYFF
ncbi:MAG: hypothetical protein DDT42_01851 [candidate division WS2 bacterium]|uniref:Uncharacterized protein n=1 Tax=Psychracetigena formicireducens TaxID=2986056 RepID=A0A9E2BJ12_PSYF1|nr:hypothetical protein [Candidatus Psychracetigena formicireducens]